MLILVLLMAIICVRRRQLAVLATGGADQVQPRPGACPLDDTKSLPPIVDVGWTTDTSSTDRHRRGSTSCDPEFQIVRNIVQDPWDGSAPWKSTTLQSPSRMMSSPAEHSGADDCTAELCHVYVSTPNNTTGRLHRTPPQLQTFSVSCISVV